MPGGLTIVFGGWLRCILPSPAQKGIWLSLFGRDYASSTWALFLTGG
jgi:hypothetical protein